MRTLLRPTGFVDSPFGHDGKVARLAGGLNWFAAVELIRVEGKRRVATELVPVEGIEARLRRCTWRRDWAALTAPRAPLQLGERTIRLDQPQVMGIVNATPDSFSDGGALSPMRAAAAEAGADMAARGRGDHRRRRRIDPARARRRCGKATRSSACVPVVQQLAAGGTAVSIDTRKAGVMSAALGAGARLVNDVSALTWDPQSAEVVAAAGVPVVLMHHQGDPADDAGRAALRRRAGRGLSVARGADRGGRGGGDRARRRSSSIPASASARRSRTISS